MRNGRGGHIRRRPYFPRPEVRMSGGKAKDKGENGFRLKAGMTSKGEGQSRAKQGFFNSPDEGANAFPRGRGKTRLLKPNRPNRFSPPRVHKRGNPPIGIDFPRGILPRPAKNPVTPNAGKCAARSCRARGPDNPTEHPAPMRARASPMTRYSPSPPLKKPCVPRAAYRNLNAYSFLLRQIYAGIAISVTKQKVSSTPR